MTTPQRKRHNRTRRTILDTTLDLVRTQGIDKVSWRAIARAVDYSPSGMYEYFDSKDHIIQTLAAEGMETLDGYLAQSDSDSPIEDRIVDAGAAYIRFAHDHPTLFDLAFSSLPSKRTTTDQAPAGAYKRLYDIVQQGIDAALFPSVPETGADGLTYLLWSLFHGMASLQLTHLRDFDALFDQTDRFGIRAFVRGLSA